MELRDLEFIKNAHANHCKKGFTQVRIFDGKTPYDIHLIWCATMILQEPTLPRELREKGSQILLYHDLLEDTNKKLPQWLSKEVKSLISEMTFESSEDEWKNLWNRSKETRLLKLFDKVNNMMDAIWMKPERKKQHMDHLRKLCKDVEKNYGKLNIVKFAKTMI